MTKTVEETVYVELRPMTFFDRDKAVWKVEETEYDGQPVLSLTVVEDGGQPKRVVFHKDDAAWIIMLINEATK